MQLCIRNNSQAVLVIPAST